jgi:hypothetical protein
MFFFFYLDVLKIVVLDFHALPNFTSFNTSVENFSFLHVDYIDLTQVINTLQKANESSFQLMKTNYHSNQSVNLHRSINFV